MQALTACATLTQVLARVSSTKICRQPQSVTRDHAQMAAASAMHAVLESRPVLLADGATGTNLLQMRLAAGDSVSSSKLFFAKVEVLAF